MIMKKQLLLLVAILLPMVASADPVEINGIYYNLVTKARQAEVTSNPNYYESGGIIFTYTYSGNIVIPETINYNNITYSVTSIGSAAFGGGSITTVTIPNSVTSIGSSAFAYCSSLTSVTIPNSVTSIGNYTFKNCSSLTSITIPNSVTSIGDCAFEGCTGLTSVTIPNSVTSIGSNAFAYCSSLEKVIVPDIAAWCGIKFDTNNANPLYYAKHLYSDENTEIKDLVIPNSVTSIGNDAFRGCTGLTSVNIGNSVTHIGNYAFWYCSGLTSVTIPNSVTSIGNNAFQNCSSLTSITIPNSVTSIDNAAFRDCSGLTSVTIGNSVTNISQEAFFSCTGLTSVTLPNSVTSIGDYAFKACTGLTSVNIGSGIKTIGSQAFAKCSDLTDVFCYAEKVPNTNNNAYNESYIDYATLHVPASSVNAYNAVDPWKNFKNVVALEGETPTAKKCEKPTINYQNGKLTFASNTEGATCQYSITDSDIKSGSGDEVQLTATYNISVYATKAGYDNSDVATATLCWIDVEPKTEGINNSITQVPAKAVLIQAAGGAINVQGCDDGERIGVYSINGSQVGTAISQNGAATVNTTLQSGSVAIIKVGQKSIKVMMK